MSFSLSPWVELWAVGRRCFWTESSRERERAEARGDLEAQEAEQGESQQGRRRAHRRILLVEDVDKGIAEHCASPHATLAQRQMDELAAGGAAGVGALLGHIASEVTRALRRRKAGAPDASTDRLTLDRLATLREAVSATSDEVAGLKVVIAQAVEEMKAERALFRHALASMDARNERTETQLLALAQAAISRDDP